MKKREKNLDIGIQSVYICAFRYALGRATYMPGVIMEEIDKVITQIGICHIEQFISDIDHAVKHKLLDAYWKKEWLRWADKLRKHVKEREEK